MGKIIAIGGGEMGRPHENSGFYPIETLSIDKEIVKQSKKKNPKLLFLGTASNYSESYFKVVQKHFSKLGCKVNNLRLIKDELSHKEIEKQILFSDIIYVGGGNIEQLLTTWSKFNLKIVFEKAYQQNIILAGLSAGAMCWFKYCDNQEQVSKNEQWNVFPGLNIISEAIYPHFNLIGYNINRLKKLSKEKNIIFVALSDCTALEIIDNKYRILKSKLNAKAYKIYWKNNKYYQEEIPSTKEFGDLNTLLTK